MVGVRTSRSLLLFSVLFGVGCGQGNLPQTTQQTGTETDAVAGSGTHLQIVTSEKLRGAIEAQRGNVVVVDFWATWCRPCKKEFPNLVELHHKHRADGVVCMSVSVNEEDEKDAALNFLLDHHATFPNFLLDEEATVWQEQWNMKGVPAVFVYDRDGKLAQKFDKDDPDNQFTYADVNRLVILLLAKGR
jgi:thiol-disulfide isomerase/thioredoxin